MKLSVIVAVYNEERFLPEVMNMLLSAPCPLEREWIFVDDGSSDRSLSILQDFAKNHTIRVIEQKPNQGKGAALIRGIKEATGDFILIQDADFEYDPGDVPALLQPLIDGKADVVYGSRFKHSVNQVHRTYHYFINRLLTTLSNLLSGVYLTDMETCYKAFRSDLVKAMNLNSKRFGIEIEFTAYIAKLRVRIYELPISYFPRTRLSGKKIGWRDGVAALIHLIRYNLFISTEDAFGNKIPQKYVNPPLLRPLEKP